MTCTREFDQAVADQAVAMQAAPLAQFDHPTTLLLHLLQRAPYTDQDAAEQTRQKLRAQTELLREARTFLNMARLYLEDYAKFEAATERYPTGELPPAVAAFLGEGVTL